MSRAGLDVLILNVTLNCFLVIFRPCNQDLGWISASEGKNLLLGFKNIKTFFKKGE